MKAPVPEQQKGKHIDLHSEKIVDNDEQAKEFFSVVKNRLLHSEQWHDIAKVPAATFILTDREGQVLSREMRENDLIRIDIPGPENDVGYGYDWVRVDRVINEVNGDNQLFSITLRPTSNPESEDKEIAHFFTGLASSTLLVKQEGQKVSVEYHGRNELINLDSSNLSDKIRNIVVGMAAKLGMSYSQWKGLIEGLVEA